MKSKKLILIFSLMIIALISGVYFSSTSQAEDNIKIIETKSGVTFDKSIGACGFIDDPVENVLSAVGTVREYHNYRWVTEVQNECRFTQGTWWNWDSYYKKLNDLGIDPVPCIQGTSKADRDGYNGNKQQKPINSDEDSLNPESYKEHASTMFQYAARYGNVEIEDSKLLLEDGQTRVSGLGYIKYYENWNEPDKSWEGDESHFSGAEYAAMSSSDYDGHEGKLGDTYGIKNADPDSKLVMGGIAGGRWTVEYLEEMKAWAEENRTDKKIPIDVINFHMYSGPDCPEKYEYIENFEKIATWRDENAPELEIWMTEFGWDTNTESPNGTTEINQRDWLIRTYLIANAHGIDRSTMYMSRDVGASSSTGKYSTSGLTTQKDKWAKKASWYGVATLKNTLEGFKIKKIVEQNDRIYNYKFVNDSTKEECYVIWSPTQDGTQINDYSLNIGKSREAKLVTLQNNSITGEISDLLVNDGEVSVNVSETPIFIKVNKIENEAIFYDDFSDEKLDLSKWLIADKAWGGNNGGVVPKNVSVENGILKLEGHGNKYTGDVPGINRPDGTKTGAAIATREYFGSGSYEVVAKVAPELGACSAIWTFEYEEYYPGEEGYESHGGTGSYYAVNHEIDIEMPGRASSGATPSYEYALCNTWIGEKGKEYTTGYTKLPSAQNDGKFHKYRFDWHTGDDGEEPRVEFYFDDELITINTTHIPTNEGRLWIGLWFPNGWAGTPDFDTAVFEIDSVKITPFNENGDTKQNETYGKDGWAPDSFPEDIEKENYNHIINGDFEKGQEGWTLNGDAQIKDGNAILTSGSKTDTISQAVSVYPKMTYTLTADVITDGTAVTIGTKKLNGEGDNSVTVTESGKVKLVFTTSSGIKELKAYIEVLRYQEIKNEVRVDNVTLYSGIKDDEENNEKPLSFKVNLKTDKEVIKPGETFKIVANISEIEKNSSNGLMAIAGKLEYDKNSLEIVENSAKGLGKWDFSNRDYNKENYKFVANSNDYITEKSDIFEITFKVKEDCDKEDLEMKLTDVSGGTGELQNGLINTENVSLNIKLAKQVEDKITSKIYTVGETYISKISPNTTVKEFINNVETESELVFKNSKGEILKETDIITTGTKLEVGTTLNYELVISGDLDGDGKITVNDIAKIKLHCIEREILEKCYLEASKLDNDNIVGINDLAILKLMYLGKNI